MGNNNDEADKVLSSLKKAVLSEDIDDSVRLYNILRNHMQDASISIEKRKEIYLEALKVYDSIITLQKQARGSGSAASAMASAIPSGAQAGTHAGVDAGMHSTHHSNKHPILTAFGIFAVCLMLIGVLGSHIFNGKNATMNEKDGISNLGEVYPEIQQPMQIPVSVGDTAGVGENASANGTFVSGGKYPYHAGNTTINATTNATNMTNKTASISGGGGGGGSSGGGSGGGEIGGSPADTTPPSVSISYSPSNPNSTHNLTFTAVASDANDISQVRIYVNGSNVKNCTSSPCNYTTGTYNNGTTITYYANATDTYGNTNQTEVANVIILDNVTDTTNNTSNSSDCGDYCGQYLRFFYVSNSSGNDSNSGNSTVSAWKTISKVNSQAFLPGDAVLFKRGDVWNETLIVNASGNSTHSIVFGAYSAGDKPLITGFTTLSSWISMGGGVYAANCTVCNVNLSMVTLNGTAQGIGRYPNVNESNGGYLTYESHSGKGSITDNELTGTPNWTGAEVTVRSNRWSLGSRTILTHTTNTLTFSNLTWEPTNGFGYFIQNDPRTLDRLGEWYFNSTSKKFLMYFGANDPDDYVVQASTIENLSLMEGKSYITFDNLKFTGANQRGISLKDSQHFTVQDCDFDFSGKYGIYGGYYGLTNSYAVINNSHFNNTYTYAIYFSGTHNTITNSTIDNTNLILGMGNTGIGILSYGSNLLIQGNRVTNAGYAGIQFYDGNHTQVKDNYISNVCLKMDDCGGIYTSGTAEINKTISGNNLSNGAGNGEGTTAPDYREATGIYMDWPSANYDVFGNTVYNYSLCGIYTNTESHDNNIHDNILANNSEQIFIIGSSNTTIANNMITGNASHGILLNINSDNNIVANNTVTLDKGVGILLIASSENNLVANNTVTNNADVAIYLYNASNNNLTGNIGMSATSSRGIYITYGSHNNILTNNIGVGNSSQGIFIGISDNNTLINNTGTSSTNYGLYIYYSSNTSITRQSATGYLSGSTGAYIRNSNNTLFADCVNISGYLRDILMIGTSLNNTFLNCSYDLSKETINETAILYRKWYSEANITNSTGSPVGGANVTIYNRTGSIVYSGVTNSSGRMDRTALTEYVNLGGNRTYQTPHNITVTKTGYGTNVTVLNISLSGNTWLDVILGDEYTVAPNYAAIALVASGDITDANALWWGFNESDSTASLQAALNSNATRITIPYVDGLAWEVESINISSNKEIYLEPGVVVEAIEGGMLGVYTGQLLKLIDKENITISGYGAQLLMRKTDYTQSPYNHSEWRHAINILGSKNISVLGVRVADSGGDGIDIGASQTRCTLGHCQYSENILVKDVVSDNNYRQGISVTATKNMLIDNCTFINTNGTPPQCGIDFEPNYPWDQMTNITLRNSVFTGNVNFGIMLSMWAYNETSTPMSITIENCTSENNTYGAFDLYAPSDDYGLSLGYVRVINNTFIGDTYYSYTPTIEQIIEFNKRQTLSACANLSVAGTTYTLSGNVYSGNATCFNVTAADITLDCNGSSVIGDNTAAHYGAYSEEVHTYIRDCDISNFSNGVYFRTAYLGRIENTTVNTTYAFSWPYGNGIFLYNNAKYNRVINTQAYSSAGNALRLYVDSNRNFIYNFTGMSNSGNGVHVYYSYNNTIWDSTASSASSNGIAVHRGINNIFANILITGKDDTYGALKIYSNSTNNRVENCTINGKGGAYAITLKTGNTSWNRLINNTIMNATTLVYLDNNASDNLFYWNNFTDVSGYYAQDMNGVNLFNSSVGEGNVWHNVVNGSVNITGASHSAGYPALYIGTGGSGHPYDATTSKGKVVGAVDWRPLTYQSNGTSSNMSVVSSHLPTTPTSSEQVVYSASANDTIGLSQLILHYDYDNITVPCLGQTTCGLNVNGGPYSSGTSHPYYATATNILNESINSSTHMFTVS